MRPCPDVPSPDPTRARGMGNTPCVMRCPESPAVRKRPGGCSAQVICLYVDVQGGREADAQADTHWGLALGDKVQPHSEDKLMVTLGSSDFQLITGL